MLTFKYTYNYPSTPLEEYQTSKNTFAFGKQVSPTEYENTTHFFKCREFLTDILIQKYLKKPIFKIYEMKSKLKDHPEENILFIHLPITEYKNLSLNLHFLHTLEDWYKLPEKTSLEPLEIDKTTKTKRINFSLNNKLFIIKTNPFWFSHPYLLSFFTFLLRILTYQKYNNLFKELFLLNNSDAKLMYQHIYTNEKKELFILTIIYLKELCENESPILHDDEYTQHSINGIFSFLKYNTNNSILREKLVTLYNNNKNKKEEALCQEDVAAAILF